MIRPGILCQRQIMRKYVLAPTCFLKKRMLPPETPGRGKRILCFTRSRICLE
jgi:hypothetical protein